jgi:hypothetical protein
MIRFSLTPLRPLALRTRLTPLTTVVAFALVALLARPAVAQDQATIDKLVQLNKKAMDDYDTADFDTAKKALLDAEKTGKRAGLESHPVMARTYIHLGALYLMGYKDKQKAQHYFGKALDIQSDIKLDKNLTSAAVKDLFASVQAQHGGGSDDTAAAPPAGRKNRARAEPEAEPVAQATESETEAPAPRRGRGRKGDSGSGGEPDLPANIEALDCPTPDETPPGKKVTLRCAAAANLGIASVTVYYKGFEMNDFEPLTMEKSPKGWWQAAIPKTRVNGKSLQFYFEGMDESDKPVVSNGRAESPNVMLIVAHVAGEGPAKKKNEEENPLDVVTSFEDRKYGNRRFWIGVGVGTGFAFAIKGLPESRVNNYYDQTLNGFPPITGGGWAGLGQVAPEIGLQLNPLWAISIEGRDQYIPQAAAVSGYTASGAHAILFKVIRYTRQARARLFFAAAGGGGEGIRMNIYSDPTGRANFKDSILIGHVLVGGTAGFVYDLGKSFTWMIELNALAGFPKTGIGFDVNTAIQFNFGDTSGRAEAAAKHNRESASGSVDADDDPKD